MSRRLRGIPPERREQIEATCRVSGAAVRQALRRHMLLGESVAVGDEDGGVRILGPDQIREVLERLEAEEAGGAS